MTPSIKRSHNVSELVYHLVFPVKYRRKIFTDTNEETLKTLCLEFGSAYDINFLEIGIDEDHVHFLIQTIPNIRSSDMVKKIKSITACHIFKTHKEVKQKNVGRKLLDTRILCEHSRTVWKLGYNTQLHIKTRNTAL